MHRKRLSAHAGAGPHNLQKTLRTSNYSPLYYHDFCETRIDDCDMDIRHIRHMRHEHELAMDNSMDAVTLKKFTHKSIRCTYHG